MSTNKQEQHPYPSPHLLPQPYNFQSFSASTSPITSTAMPSMVTSPAMSPFDPAIGDTEIITPLTSVNVTPADALKKKDPVIIEEDDEIFSLDADTDEGTVVPAEGKVMAGTSYEADRDELKRRVWESVHGKGKQVESWGHRGASAVWPENTMASFRATCQAGAQGIETDIHVTRDDVLVMFHDPRLDRTTNGTGRIDDLPWYGHLEHVRTKQAPIQPLPRFSEVVSLLMEPENIHVKLNIDCKPNNNPEKLFPMIRDELSKYDDWEVLLAPRIVLGIWHPKFIKAAKTYLSHVTLYAICMSVQTVRDYFFEHCAGFSICFPALYAADGKKFREQARAAGKNLTVWTVNDRSEMLECIRWGVRAVITDRPANMVDLQMEIAANPAILLESYFSRVVMPWTSTRYFAFHYTTKAQEEHRFIESEAGKWIKVSKNEY